MKNLFLIAILSLLSLPSWAQVKISQMPSGGTTAAGDLVPVVRGGVNFKTTFAPTASSGVAGAVQTSDGAGGFNNFLLSTTTGTGSAVSGLLFNGGSTTQALSVGSFQGWSNQVSPSPLAAYGLYQLTQGLIVDPRNYGAVCDAQYADGRTYVPRSLGNVTLTASSPVISISGYAFKTADIGKTISVNAGSGGTAGVATGTIISIGTAGANATLSVTPTVSTSGGYAVFGHDDTAGFVAAANQAKINGGYVIVPSNCAVREMALPNFVSLIGQAVETDYDYNFILPVMFILSTGFTDDSTSYGINISDYVQVALKGFEIRGLVFPQPASVSGFANANLSCVGTSTGTDVTHGPTRAGIVLDTMSIQNCFVGMGSKLPLTTQGGHISFESRFSEYSANAWGMHGGFTDGAETGDVYTGNFGYGAMYWGQGSGYNTTAMRLVGVRSEEDKVGLYCDGCSGNHLEASEFQFETGNSIILNGQWYAFWMTGGFIESNGGLSRTPVLLSGGGNFSHPTASFVNVLTGGATNFIDYEATAGTANPTVSYLGGLAYTDAQGNTPMQGTTFVNAGTGNLYVTRYQPANAPSYIVGTGVTDLTINSNHALGLSTTNANLGTILDMGLASSTTNSSVLLPKGTTGNRPTTGINGMLRYNTTTNAVEGYVNGVWGSIGGAGGVTVKTANYTVLAGDTNTTFTNTGAAGLVAFTLPTAAASLNYCFFVDAAQSVAVVADGGHTIRNGASVTTTGGNFTSNAIGNQMCVRALNTTEWYVYSGPTGSWTVN